MVSKSFTKMCDSDFAIPRQPSFRNLHCHGVERCIPVTLGRAVVYGNDIPQAMEEKVAKNKLDGPLELERLAQENSKLWHIVEGHYVPSNQQPAGMLDNRMAYVSDAVEQANLSSILFISRPVAAALTKYPFQLALLIISLFFFLEFSFELTVLSTSEWGFRSSMVRFVATQLRNGQSVNISHPHVKSFGLLHDSFAMYNADFAVQGNAIVAHYSERIHATGFFVVTAPDSSEFDATRFHLESSDDNGQTWRRVAASASRFGFGGRMELIDGSARMPLAREEAVFFSLAPHWEVYVNGPLRSFLSTLFFALTAVLARLGLPWAARSAFIAGFLCTCILCFVVALGNVARGQYTISCVWWTEALGNLIIPISVVWLPQKLVLALLFLGIYYLVVLSVVIHFVAGFAFSDMIYTLVAGSVMASTALLVFYVREYFLIRSKNTMLPDKEAYDKNWSTLVEQDTNHDALARLSTTASRLEAELSHAPARQYNRQRIGGARPRRGSGTTRRSSLTGFNAGIPGSLDLTNPVCSLDQLYSQAVALDVILREKVKSWAELGLFPVLPGHLEVPDSPPGSPSPPSFVKWAEAREDEELRRKVKWGTIKSSERATEKSVRNYHSDVSYLVDIVRQYIVFETVHDMVQALEDICQDPDVRVVRIKNRMDATYDSWSSAGYRDVSINLRISTDETQRLGIENHVAEIQLVLLQFARLRQDSGHTRYVAWRNERGC